MGTSELMNWDNFTQVRNGGGKCLCKWIKCATLMVVRMRTERMRAPLYSNRDLRKLLLPLIAEQVLTALMGVADTLMVSNVSAAALSGVSLVDTLNNLIIMIFSAMAAGGTIVCAQYLGRGDPEDACDAAEQVLLSCIAIALVPAVLCATLSRPILGIVYTQLEPDVMDNAVRYFLISALSYPFLAMQQAAAALFRAAGESKTPMKVTLVANVINIAGNALLIYGVHLGVTGAALATLFSRMVSGLTLLVFLRQPTHKLQVTNYRKLRPNWRIIKMILRIGVPTGLENGLFQFGKLIVAGTVSTLGTAAISAHAMVQLVEGIHGYPSQAINIGLTTVAGTCMGAGRVDEAKKYTKKLCYLSWLAMFILSIPIALLLGPIADIASLDGQARTLFLNIMVIALVAKLLLWVPAFSLPKTLQAAGDVKFTAAVSAASMWVFRAGLSFVICRVTPIGLYGVWLGWFIDWICRSAFYITRYLSGKWEKIQVLDT